MGAMADWEKVLNFFQVDISLVRNKTESTYQLKNTLVEFIGLEQAEAKGHSSRREIMYFNEVNQRISYDAFIQFYMRTSECVWVDYNPCAEFWLTEKILPTTVHSFIHSTYRDNPLLSEVERANIESRKDDPKFAAWFRVYGDGLMGYFEGCIFQNWKIGSFDESLPVTFGLDIGSRDPDALLRCAVDNKNKIIYADELLYQNNLSTKSLVEAISHHVKRSDLIIADSANRQTIADLREARFRVIPASKGPGSVKNGIKKMLGYEIVISERSKNLAYELRNYAWADKKTVTPVEGADHLCDALRYAFMFKTTYSHGLRRIN
jgi:phage terminase large subunit